MTDEEAFVDRDRLDRPDALVRNQLLDTVDEKHRVAMRKRRHHPLHVERTRGGEAERDGHFEAGAGGEQVAHARQPAVEIRRDVPWQP